MPDKRPRRTRAAIERIRSAISEIVDEQQADARAGE
jgi:hypothetical protein